MDYLLGIDIGTTSVKTIAFSKEGIMLSSFSVSYGIDHPFPDWSEQDPEEIVSAVIQTVEKILQDCAPALPKLCSFSSAMHSLIAVDQQGLAISPSIIWADNRASGISARIHKENRAEEFYQLTGLPVHAMSPFCKLIWLKENQEEIFKKAHKFIGIKEYIFYRLFGIFAIDVSVASATGLLNARTLEWEPQILGMLGITKERLAEIVSIDKVFYGALLFPSLEQIPFVIGGSDGAMANLGSTEEARSLVITVGTSSAARIILNKPWIDPRMRTFCYFINNNQWLIGGASNNGGIVLQWLQEDFFKSDKTVTQFLAQAALVRPGSDGLIFLPYLLGERAPIWDENAKGILFGVQIGHSQATMIRASLEGIVYCIFAVSQAILEQSDILQIVATGGFARNELGLQIMADVFNLPVLVCDTIENSAWGAAKCGMMALGLQAPPKTPIGKTYHPNSSAHVVYKKGFLKFQQLYEKLKDEFIG